ncbi:MAG: hypothetical protein ACRED6_11835 [Stellaceae bacterium]
MAIEVSTNSAARRGARVSALSVGYWALALIPIAALFVLAALSPPMALNDYLSDDAYYYLRVAANIAHGAGSTFGNLVPTNGYHPLWQLALVPVFWIIRAPDAAIPAVFVIGSAAWIACVALYRRIGAMCDAEAAFLCGGIYLCWLCTFALPGGAGLVFLGMETTLALPIMLWLVELSLRRAIFTAAPQPRRTLLTVGVALTLMCLARLEAVFIATAYIGAFVLMQQKRGLQAALRDGIVMGAPIAITLIIYMAANQILFGAAMPVSGAAKALGAPFANLNPLIASLWGASTLQARTIPLGLVFIAEAATVLALAWRKSGDARTDAMRQQLVIVAGATLAGTLLHLAYLCVGSSWPIWAWYGYGRAVGRDYCTAGLDGVVAAADSGFVGDGGGDRNPRARQRRDRRQALGARRQPVVLLGACRFRRGQTRRAVAGERGGGDGRSRRKPGLSAPAAEGADRGPRRRAGISAPSAAIGRLADLFRRARRDRRRRRGLSVVALR